MRTVDAFVDGPLSSSWEGVFAEDGAGVSE